MQGNSQLVLVQPLSLEPPKPQYGGDATDALFEELAKRVDKKLAAQARQGGQKHKKAEESSSDDEFHPPDPQHCNVQGPGFAGGHAGAPVKLVVHVKDERGKRIKEGGEEVTVRVRPPVGVGHVSVEVTDNNDGTYTAIYTPPIKGNYSLTVEVNGMSLAGSPFPVFFSSPLDPAQLAAEEAAERAAASTPTPLPPPPLLGAPSGGASWMSDPAAQMVSNAAAAGTAAAAAISDEHLRTLYISNISPAIPFDRLHELFSIFGNVIDLRPLGDSKDMAVVLFSNKEAQSQGQQLNNTMFGDRPLSVTAPITAMAAGVVPANPALAMQMQQIQQMQAAMAATQKLAIQVASMRAFAKSGQAMPREDPTRAADAVARLNKKFGAGGGAPGGIGAALVAAAAAAAAAAQANANSAQDEARAARAAQDKRVSRSRSRSGSPRRRRSRSRDGHDRRGGRDGRREADRRDREARERREREEREWERAREREREREKEMHRERALAKERERDRDRARERDRDRERRDKERKRSRSRSGDRKRSSRADDKDRGKERDREKDRGRDKEKEREKDRGRKEVSKKESSKHRAESPSARPKALAARSESPDASPSRADAAPSKPSKAEATPSKPSKAEAQEAQGALGSSPPAAVHADPPTKDAEEGGAPQAGKAVHEPSPAAHEPSPGAPSLSSVPTASVAAVVKAAGGDGEKKGGRHRERSYRRRSHSPS